MTSQEYWEERERQKQQKVDEITDAEVEKIRKAIEDAISDLDRQIHDIYMKYAIDNKMDYYDALQYLTDDERKEFQRDLQYYLDKYKDSDYVKKHKKELHSLSVRARVQRIEAFIANIKQHASDLEEMLNTGAREEIASLYSEGYLRNAYDILGGQAPTPTVVVPAFNTRVVREIMETPWSGKNYSTKVWDISTSFENKLEEVLTRGLIQGRHPDVIAREFRAAGFGKERRNKDGSIRKGGVAWSAEALIRTEAANLIEQAQLDSYKEFNTERYVFMTSKDHKVCDTCAELEGKDFAIEEAKAGVNYPPMHPICRCTSRAKTRYDDEDESQYDLPYDEWYAQYVQPEIDKIHRERLNKDSKGGKIDIEIDELTECLRDTKTNTLVDTEVKTLSRSKIKNLTKGWLFDWSKVEKGDIIRGLYIKGGKDLQGLVAIRDLPLEHAMYVNLVEAKPSNVGSTGRYKGVGGHLFAEACKMARDNGYDYIYFDAKTNLVEYYKDELGADRVFGQRMVIDGEAFYDLIKKYYKEG
jgi:phage putative head morphogenesis protein, SPP1 gp7 family